MNKLDKDLLDSLCESAQDFAKMQRQFWYRKSITWKWSFLVISTLSYFIINQSVTNENLPLVLKILFASTVSIILIMFTRFLSALLKSTDAIQNLCDVINNYYFNLKCYLLEEGSFSLDSITKSQNQTSELIANHIEEYKKLGRSGKKVCDELEEMNNDISKLKFTEQKLDFSQLLFLFHNQLFIPSENKDNSPKKRNIARVAQITELNYKNFRFDSSIKIISFVFLLIFLVQVFYKA